MQRNATCIPMLILLASLLAGGCIKTTSRKAETTWSPGGWESFHRNAAAKAALDNCIEKIVADLKSEGYSTLLLIGVVGGQPAQDVSTADSQGTEQNPFVAAQRLFVEKARSSGIQAQIVTGLEAVDQTFISAHPSDAIVKANLVGFGSRISESKTRDWPKRGKKTTDESIQVTVSVEVRNPQTSQVVWAKMFEGTGEQSR